MFFAVVLILLTLSSRPNMTYAMPLLLPLSLLAAVELDNLKRGAAAFLNWFGLMTFGFFALLVWAGWAAMNFGWPQAWPGAPSTSALITRCRCPAWPRCAR